jgi:hypothetical protein
MIKVSGSISLDPASLALLSPGTDLGSVTIYEIITFPDPQRNL